MLEKVLNIISSEFFWGIIIGGFLSLVGAYASTRFNLRVNNAEFRRRQSDFCIELVENVRKFADELDQHRARADTIHHDFLDLIEVEVGIYGRNRENLMLLPRDARAALQKFMSDIAIRRAQIVEALGNFQSAYDAARSFQMNGNQAEADKAQSAAGHQLEHAKVAADKLLVTARTAPEVVKVLKPSTS